MSSVYETLKEKLDQEMVEFKQSYESMERQQIYNDWYIIGFYEEYAELLSGTYIQNRNPDNVIGWLASMNKPLAFLYREWLGCDDPMSHDWDVMLDWVESLYEELVVEAGQKSPPLAETIATAEAEVESKKTWVEEKREELDSKPRSEWTEEDWEAHNYCENVSAEADYYDSLDDR